MRRNIANKFLLICAVLAIVSCKAKKQAIASRKSADSSGTVAPEKNELKAIKARQTTYTTFSGRARTSLNINGSGNDVTLNIRIEGGKKIWVSVTAIAGIEVARALITPDSLLVINKLQGLYLRKPFSYVYKYTSKHIDYHSLEALLVGNAIPQLLNADAKIQADSGKVTLSGNLQNLIYKLVTGPDLKVSHTELANQAEGQSLAVDNSTFIQAGNKILPSQINMSSTAGTKKIQVNLHYVKADFDLPLEYPFSIPARYSQAN